MSACKCLNMPHCQEYFYVPRWCKRVKGQESVHRDTHARAPVGTCLDLVCPPCHVWTWFAPLAESVSPLSPLLPLSLWLPVCLHVHLYMCVHRP
eukprot:303803-Pelagomonas_calceolata.AAC.3